MSKGEVKVKWTSKEKIFLAFTGIIAVFARVYKFGSIPFGINQDEAMAGYNAYTLMHDGLRDIFGFRRPMYLTAWGSGMNALESYLAMPFIKAMGTTNISLRLVPLILNLLSLLAVYKASRLFTCRLKSVFILFIFSVMPWHIMAGRWALESNLLPYFLTFGTAFFLYGMMYSPVEKSSGSHHSDNSSGSKAINKSVKYSGIYFLLSSFMFGMSLYTYAAIWMTLPFVLIFMTFYAHGKKRFPVNRYTIASIIIFILFYIPVLLFYFFNKGIIGPLKLPLLTIPKLLYFRSEEVGLNGFFGNFLYTFSYLIIPDDGLVWNSFPKTGLFYYISVIPFFVGLSYSLFLTFYGIKIRLFKKIITPADRKNINDDPVHDDIRSIPYIMVLIIFVCGFFNCSLTDININRANVLWMPYIFFIAVGLIKIFSINFIRSGRRIKMKNEENSFSWKKLFILTLIYLVMFIIFEVSYLSTYNKSLGNLFSPGLSEAVNIAEKYYDESYGKYRSPVDLSTDELMDEFERSTYDDLYIFITDRYSDQKQEDQGAPKIYLAGCPADFARVMYYSHPDLADFLTTVHYDNYPSAYLNVASFCQYDFNPDMNSGPDGRSIYIITPDSNEGTNLLEGLNDPANGHTCIRCGIYNVYLK
ncbi:MAG: hypothetical protein VZR00_06950 [Lachnospiraceae bacterium]|nr:hypothetical protein [Lachnospiraceae bacterium]MEE3461610.1 hypothetical protein [Lachnospiraceae bacterium]